MAVWILSEAEQLELDALYRTGYLTQKQLAHYFCVSTSTVGKVLTRFATARHKQAITIPQARLLKFCTDHALDLLQIQKALNLVERVHAEP